MKLVDSSATPSVFDHDEIARALALMTDGVFEIRIPKAGRYRTIRGYFNDPMLAARAVAAWSGKVPAVYLTLNPVNPALLARASNRVETFAESTTCDADILARRWLLVDIDPKRPAGISSSHSEHQAALVRAKDVAGWLSAQGWPEPIQADSGNGAHLLYRIALANDPENTQTLATALKALAARFDTAAVCVDTSVYNASRISKLYGTQTCKGDDTADRPHRLSRILSAPAEPDVVALELLEELARQFKPESSRPTRPVSSAPDFFGAVNTEALARLSQWVPVLFPSARPYRNGYRVTSQNLERDLEEDLGIQPDGIKDFGLQDQGDSHGGRRSPITLVMEWGQASDALQAALWLCRTMGLSPESLGWKARGSAPQDFRPPIESYEQDFILEREITPAPAAKENSPPKPTGQEFIPLAEFIAKPPSHSYLIKKILPARGMGQVFGSSNVGKSFLLIDIAMHIAAGLPWRGFRTKQAPVLYIAAEGLAGLAGRMKAWTQRYKSTPEMFFVRPFPVGLTIKGAAAAMAARLAELPYLPMLIVLDTLAANFGPGSENDAEDMSLALAGLRDLGGDWLTMCVHHSGHADKTRSRGHSSLFAALDIEFCVTRDDPLGPIKVAHSKCRDMDRMDPLFFTLESESLPWCDEDGDPISSAVLVPCDAVEEPPIDTTTPLGGKKKAALDLLREMYDQQQRNLGDAGTARVFLSHWYGAMDFEPDKSHRNRIKRELETRGFIYCDKGFVYLC